MQSIINELGYNGKIKKLDSNRTSEIIVKVEKFLFILPHGQMHRDCQLRKYNMIGFSFGVKNHPNLSDAENKRLKIKKISDIYIGEADKDTNYSIYNQLYIDFLRELFKKRTFSCWFLTGSSLKRTDVYEGPIDLLLNILEHGWGIPYEFTFVNPKLTWAIDYNHHHSVVILGKYEADQASTLLQHEEWSKYLLTLNHYLQNIKKTQL